ncbi:uncharacterized protein V1516DRAFT_71377 [Lipomyces oligophaga]|uniref:uncharacterized protein n=1 Tax=Lipomyces oligophaga TaxID=45792 RepID=UPI0034CE8EB3
MLSFISLGRKAIKNTRKTIQKTIQLVANIFVLCLSPVVATAVAISKIVARQPAKLPFQRDILPTRISIRNYYGGTLILRNQLFSLDMLRNVLKANVLAVTPPESNLTGINDETSFCYPATSCPCIEVSSDVPSSLSIQAEESLKHHFDQIYFPEPLDHRQTILVASMIPLTSQPVKIQDFRKDINYCHASKSGSKCKILTPTAESSLSKLLYRSPDQSNIPEASICPVDRFAEVANEISKIKNFASESITRTDHFPNLSSSTFPGRTGSCGEELSKSISVIVTPIKTIKTTSRHSSFPSFPSFHTSSTEVDAYPSEERQDANGVSGSHNNLRVNELVPLHKEIVSTNSVNEYIEEADEIPSRILSDSVAYLRGSSSTEYHAVEELDNMELCQSPDIFDYKEFIETNGSNEDVSSLILNAKKMTSSQSSYIDLNPKTMQDSGRTCEITSVIFQGLSVDDHSHIPLSTSSVDGIATIVNKQFNRRGKMPEHLVLNDEDMEIDFSRARGTSTPDLSVFPNYQKLESLISNTDSNAVYDMASRDTDVKPHDTSHDRRVGSTVRSSYNCSPDEQSVEGSNCSFHILPNDKSVNYLHDNVIYGDHGCGDLWLTSEDAANKDNLDCKFELDELASSPHRPVEWSYREHRWLTPQSDHLPDSAAVAELTAAVEPEHSGNFLIDSDFVDSIWETAALDERESSIFRSRLGYLKYFENDTAIKLNDDYDRDVDHLIADYVENDFLDQKEVGYKNGEFFEKNQAEHDDATHKAEKSSTKALRFGISIENSVQDDIQADKNHAKVYKEVELSHFGNYIKDTTSKQKNIIANDIYHETAVLEQKASLSKTILELNKQTESESWSDHIRLREECRIQENLQYERSVRRWTIILIIVSLVCAVHTAASIHTVFYRRQKVAASLAQEHVALTLMFQALGRTISQDWNKVTSLTKQNESLRFIINSYYNMTILLSWILRALIVTTKMSMALIQRLVIAFSAVTIKFSVHFYHAVRVISYFVFKGSNTTAAIVYQFFSTIVLILLKYLTLGSITTYNLLNDVTRKISLILYHSYVEHLIPFYVYIKDVSVNIVNIVHHSLTLAIIAGFNTGLTMCNLTTQYSKQYIALAGFYIHEFSIVTFSSMTVLFRLAFYRLRIYTAVAYIYSTKYSVAFYSSNKNCVIRIYYQLKDFALAIYNSQNGADLIFIARQIGQIVFEEVSEFIEVDCPNIIKLVTEFSYDTESIFNSIFTSTTKLLTELMMTPWRTTTQGLCMTREMTFPPSPADLECISGNITESMNFQFWILMAVILCALSCFTLFI